MKSQDQLAIAHLVDFIESICDEDMKSAHNLQVPLIIARKFAKIGMDNNIGKCAICESNVDRNTNFENIEIDLDDCTGVQQGVICDHCVTNHSDEELNELGMIIDS